MSESEEASKFADLELELYDAIRAIEEKNKALRKAAGFITENDLPGGAWYAANCIKAADIGPNIGDQKSVDDSAWLQFWDAYPRKVGKPDAEKKFRTQKCAQIIGVVLAALEEHKQSKQWQTPEYIPHPATWLNQRRWEQKVETQTTKEIDYSSFSSHG